MVQLCLSPHFTVELLIPQQMEVAVKAGKILLETFAEETKVDEALLKFVRQLEGTYKATQDITTFIFSLRSFFCWHRATELLDSPTTAIRIRDIWIEENDTAYTKWLVSANDEHELLKWLKWTFQAKNTILSEFIKSIQA
jgi:hypothetical protein